MLTSWKWTCSFFSNNLTLRMFPCVLEATHEFLYGHVLDPYSLPMHILWNDSKRRGNSLKGKPSFKDTSLAQEMPTFNDGAEIPDCCFWWRRDTDWE